MRYFVLAPDGQRYGPADIKTLSQWVEEGRILPSHELEEEGTGRRIPANMVAGVGFPQGQTQTRPTPPPDPFVQPPAPLATGFHAAPNDTAKLIQNAWILGAAALAMFLGFGCCSPVTAIGSVVASAFGFSYANRAKLMGDMRAQGPLIMNAVVIALAILRILASMGHFVRGPW